MPDRLIAATRGRRHPHQVLIASMCVLSGVPILAGGPRPGSISEALPLTLVYLWAVVLTACGALVVAAACVRSLEWALYLEMVADLPLSIMTAVYAVALFMFAGTRGLVPAAIVLGVAIAFGVRAWQTMRTARQVRASLTEGRT